MSKHWSFLMMNIEQERRLQLSHLSNELGAGWTTRAVLTTQHIYLQLINCLQCCKKETLTGENS